MVTSVLLVIFVCLELRVGQATVMGEPWGSRFLGGLYAWGFVPPGPTSMAVGAGAGAAVHVGVCLLR